MVRCRDTPAPTIWFTVSTPVCVCVCVCVCVIVRVRSAAGGGLKRWSAAACKGLVSFDKLLVTESGFLTLTSEEGRDRRYSYSNIFILAVTAWSEVFIVVLLRTRQHQHACFNTDMHVFHITESVNTLLSLCATETRRISQPNRPSAACSFSIRAIRSLFCGLK